MRSKRHEPIVSTSKKASSWLIFPATIRNSSSVYVSFRVSCVFRTTAALNRKGVGGRSDGGKDNQPVAKVKTKGVQVQIAWTTEFMVSVKCENNVEDLRSCPAVQKWEDTQQSRSSPLLLCYKTVKVVERWEKSFSSSSSLHKAWERHVVKNSREIQAQTNRYWCE